MIYVILALTFIALGYVSWNEHQKGESQPHPKRTLLKLGIVFCGLVGVLASAAYQGTSTEASTAPYSQTSH